MYDLCIFQEKMNSIGLNDFIVKNVYRDRHGHKWVSLKNKGFEIDITWDSIIKTKGKGLWFQYRLTKQGLMEYCSKFEDFYNIKEIEFINIDLKKRCSVIFKSYDGDTVTMTLKHLLERYKDSKIFVSKKYMLDSDFYKKIESIFESKYLTLLKINKSKKVNNTIVDFICDGREFSRKLSNCYIGMEKDLMNNYWTATSLEDHLKTKFCIHNVKVLNIYKDKDGILCTLQNTDNGKENTSKLNNVVRNGYSFNCKSQPEKIIAHILDELDIPYIYEAKFDDLKYRQKLRFDFYVPSINTCIEFDGGQHRYSVKAWGGEKGLEVRKLRDELKNSYCESKNIRLIRIPYWKNTYDLLKPIIQDIVSSN